MQRLDVVVWSCGDLGIEVANRLDTLPTVSRVTLIQAPWRVLRPRVGLVQRLRHVVRMQGPWAPFQAALRRIGLMRDSDAPPALEAPMRLHEGVEHFDVDDFHDDDALATLRGLAADLGVVAGTYILKEKVFDVPRFGSINLHSGKAPEYRGAAPAFWEMYNGEDEVGVTIHQVTRKLDAGKILLQECFPFDPAPEGDPIAYIERFRREVLRPNGVRMLAQAVDAIARGEAAETTQDHTRAQSYRSPDHRATVELRRRVAKRRSHAT